ncbi:MAG: M23 family metallopeptidase [Pigmentiphaga sp.]|nr:M23 family metallopeptidase [Pigmentiphaga sp.]
MNSFFSSIANAMLTRVATAVRHLSPRANVTRPLPSVSPNPAKRRLTYAVGFCSVCVTAAAIGFAPQDAEVANIPTRNIVESLALPDLSEQLPETPASPLSFMREERVQRGDTLATVLTRLDITDPDLESFIRATPDAQAFYRLTPGRPMQAQTNDQGEIQWLRYLTTPSEESGQRVLVRYLQVERTDEGFALSPVEIEAERHTRVAQGVIVNSLFGATDTAGIPDGIAIQIAEIMSGDIDFHRDLRRGDHFNVIYETYTHQGSFIRSGKVLALEFVNKGTAYQAAWYEHSKSGAYYSFDGKSLKKAFLRAPLEFSRISSGFSRRFHPIHKTWREHKGVDYAAPTGTPIRSTADGVIEFIGSQRGYGNTVIVKHHGNYSTLYAHMSAFAPGLRKGARISQGQMIGRVGSTGWATGPHLHYEFRIAGKQVDPLRVDLPTAAELTSQQRQAFLKETEAVRQHINLLAQLQDAPARTRLLAAK